jgi:hypothetical protein
VSQPLPLLELQEKAHALGISRASLPLLLLLLSSAVLQVASVVPPPLLLLLLQP